jgi:hypothetical protein
MSPGKLAIATSIKLGSLRYQTSRMMINET